MRLRKIRQLFIVLTALLTITIGGSDAFGQGKGKGHGGDKGDKKGDKTGENRGGDFSGQERPDHQDRKEGKHGDRQPRFEQREQREQPRFEQRQQREQPRFEERQRREQPRFETPPIYQQPRRESRRQDDDRRDDRRVDQRQLPENWIYDKRKKNKDRDRSDDEDRQSRRGDGTWQETDRRQQIPYYNNSWPNNYGYERSREVHERNDERKAWKREEKANRRERRNGSWYGNAYPSDQYYYGENQNVYQYPERQRVNYLRNVIVTFVSSLSNNGYDDNTYPQYQQSYYSDPNYSNSYDNSGGNYSFYNDNYPQYQTFAAAPYYSDVQPYGSSYDPQYGFDPNYADDTYGYSSSADSGGSFWQQLFSKLLTLGYNQGFDAGSNARRAGYGDRNYSNPYVYDDNDTMLYSNSLGENRRYMSDGYELGFEDALYDQPESLGDSNGIVDLISMFLGNGLQI